MPDHVSIFKLVTLSLERMGYETTCCEIKDFKYKSFGQRLVNFIRKTFLRDKKYKVILQRKHAQEQIMKAIKGKAPFDYVLIIRPDICNVETIYDLKKKSKKMIGYQWDGFSRFENSPALIRSFDVYGVFDKKDYDAYKAHHENLYLTQNFYFKLIPPSENKEIDILYMGSMSKDRYQITTHLEKMSRELGLKTYFRLLKDTRHLRQSPVIVTNIPLTYEELLRFSSKANCIVDIKYPHHNGLSFRFFEAIYFQQKIITNNLTVLSADFHHPNNVLAIEDLKTLDTNTLSQFLAAEYHPLSHEIKEKYSFENWFRTVIQQ